jgi:CubicO group peptidase (beta-lactamase class C family)
MTGGRGSGVLTVCVLVTSIGLGAVRLPVRATEHLDAHAVDALMLQLMSKYNVPGAALGLIKDGQIVLERKGTA